VVAHRLRRSVYRNRGEDEQNRTVTDRTRHPLPFTRHPAARAACTAGTILLVVAGCSGKGRTGAQAEPEPQGGFETLPASAWQPSTPPGPNLAEYPAKTGTLPLLYMVETEAPLRVVNLTTGRVLAQTVLPARSIVRIDPEAGVRVGSETLVPGPLAAGHTYAVYVDTFVRDGEQNRIIQIPPPKRRRR
jgi:hypothetical protein